MSTQESVKTEDEVTLILLDKNGRIKQIHGRRKQSSLEKFIYILERVLSYW